MEFAGISLKNRRKGQSSIEFMLLIVLILLYIQTIVQPVIAEGTRSLNDVMRVGQARFAAERIANAINYVNAAGEANKETIETFIPGRTRIYCNEADKLIRFVAEIDSNIPQCAYDGKPQDCDKNFALISGISLKCDLGPCSSAGAIDANCAGINPVPITAERSADGDVKITITRT